MGLTRPRLGQFQTTTTAFDDELIVLNNSAHGTNTNDIGIVFERGDNTNTALIWDESTDTVVSSNPAYLMNSECNGEYIVPVALQGRVPCRVIGVVEKGDIIVSSNVSGVGVVWNENHNPTTGSVIGKSLENKNTKTKMRIRINPFIIIEGEE